MKHCTTDKCPQILDSSCVFYEGTSLIFSGINTNDSVETVIQKLNLKLESIPVFNSNNYYTKSETYSKIEINELLDAIEVTKTELDVLITNNELKPNRLYKIIGVESWCFSQHLIKAIYLRAITNNTLESEGIGEFYTPKYNTSDDNLGIWKGELLQNGMIDSLSYNIGDKVIWGNQFWENISGEIGANIKEYYDEPYDEYFTPKLQNWLSDDWNIITPNDDESLYNVQFNKIKYDIGNDYISYREDGFGNKNELSYNTLLDYFPDSDILNFAPEFIYNINSIALFQWGRNTNSNNNISESIVINCNYKCYSFKDNSILEKSIIVENNFLNVKFEGNNIIRSSIVANNLKIYGGIINNDIEDSKVYNNKYYININNNKLRNSSVISGNSDNNIIVNNKYTIIKDNVLDNNCQISNNTFVEEGKEVDPTIKSIHGNELINNCSISNNTIKNGSRIMNHNLSYFSTINGNTLDTEANIYNNQVIQQSKIDNNILTGHSRIYRNQLDDVSEITLCKLRISPTTSHSSEIHSIRLFKGKIQNIDFGNIVNPEGTNPNDPNFGGNYLTDCIIENNSIIKDLTFPNSGGKGIQFVKMNGFSEFKNITVNDSIKNVSFINTIFNETSDYSKLIEGSGFQTGGFTKTYIDGVLLKDTLSLKLDRGGYTGTAQDLKDDINNLESENVVQYDLINDLNSELDSERARNDAQDSRLVNLEGINYIWSSTNRTLTLFDRNGTQLSQVSLVSLDNEGTDIRYNASTLSLELYNADNELLDSIPVSSFIGSVGTQLQLNSNELQLKDSQGNVLSTVSFSIVNIQGLQTALDSRLNKGSYPGNASDLKKEIDGKLNKPTITSNTTSYPFVVGEDGSGNSARLPAGDLGKNFFNSDLSNTAARNHTMNAGVTINTLGNPYNLTGLPNKEADSSFNKAIRINSSGQLGLGDTQQFNITVPDIITSNNNLSVAPLTVNHIYPNPVPNITTYVQDLQNIMATIGNLNFTKMNNWVVNTNNPTNSSQLIIGDGLVSFNLSSSQSAINGTPVVSVASQANLFPANKNFVIFFNIPKSWDSHKFGQVLVGLSQSDDNTSIISPNVAFADSYGSGNIGWSSGSVINLLDVTHIGSVFIVKSGQVIFIVICNNNTGTKVVASFDANVNGGDYRFVATMIQRQYSSEQQIPLTEIKYWVEP